jgi:hypothetical protein
VPARKDAQGKPGMKRDNLRRSLDEPGKVSPMIQNFESFQKQGQENLDVAM